MVAASFVIMVVIHGAYNTFGVFFKPVITDFGWTRAITSGAYSLSWISQALLAVVMGRLNDSLGPRLVMTICGSLLALGYLLMSQIDTVWQFYLYYGVIIGAGMGGSYVPMLSTVARWFGKRRTMMTGIVMAGMSTGILIGPPLVSRFISAYGWRVSYIIIGSIILIVVVLAAQFLKRDPNQVGQLPRGGNRAEEYELRLEAKGFSLKESMGTKQFWLISFMFFCYSFALFSIIVHIVPRATELGIPATVSPNILASMGGAAIIGMVVLGSVADRIGNRWAFIIGFILMSAALFWLIPAKELWMLLMFAGIFGLAEGSMGASEAPLVARQFGLKSLGVILGAIGMGFRLGAAVGPFVTGYIFDVMGSYQLALLLSATIAIVGLILATLLTPIKKG